VFDNQSESAGGCSLWEDEVRHYHSAIIGVGIGVGVLGLLLTVVGTFLGYRKGRKTFTPGDTSITLGDWKNKA